VSDDPRIETDVAGYRIESVLGRGGMSVVYLAEHVALRRKVAFKVIAPELARDPRFRERFVRESQIAASLEDPNVIPIYEAGEADGVLFIAMRYVRGTDLKQLIQAEGPLPTDRGVAVISQVARALDAAHRAGLVHRDVKPANVLIVPPAEPGEAEHVYLSDFGLTKRAESQSGITGTGQFIGTIDYMAPEQIEGKTVDGRADVYSLGCVLFECLTGEPPYRKGSDVALMWAHVQEPPPAPSSRRPDLPRSLDAVVVRAMAKAPDQRYRSAGELARAAQEALGPTRPSATAPPPSHRPARIWLLVAAGVAVVAAVALLLVFLPHRGTRPGHRESSPTSARNPSPTTSSGAGGVPPSSVVEIDPSTKKAVKTFPDVVNQASYIPRSDIAVGEGGVWVGGEQGDLLRVDSGSGSATRIPVTGGGGVAIGTGAIWLGSNRVDPATYEVTAVVIPTNVRQSFEPTADAVGGDAVWIASNDGTVVRIDPGTDRVVAKIKLGSDAEDVAFGAGSVWVADSLDSVVYRVDPRTNRIVGSVKLGGADLLVVGAGAVWVVDHSTGTVSRIDPATDRVTATIRVGDDPTGIAAGLGAVWVSDGADGSIYRIAPVANSVSRIPVASSLTSVAVDEQDQTLWTVVGKAS
jgi:YVTN family beta-propeller protein